MSHTNHIIRGSLYSTGNITLYSKNCFLESLKQHSKIIFGNICVTGDIQAFVPRNLCYIKDELPITGIYPKGVRIITDQDFFIDGDLHVIGNMCFNYGTSKQCWVGDIPKFDYDLNFGN